MAFLPYRNRQLMPFFALQPAVVLHWNPLPLDLRDRSVLVPIPYLPLQRYYFPACVGLDPHGQPLLFATLLYSYFSTISVRAYHGLAGFLPAGDRQLPNTQHPLFHVPHVHLFIATVRALAFVPTNTHPRFVPWGVSFLACSVPCAFDTHRCHPSWFSPNRA